MYYGCHFISFRVCLQGSERIDEFCSFLAQTGHGSDSIELKLTESVAEASAAAAQQASQATAVLASAIATAKHTSRDLDGCSFMGVSRLKVPGLPSRDRRGPPADGAGHAHQHAGHQGHSIQAGRQEPSHGHYQEVPLGRSPSRGHHIPANFLLNFRNDQRHDQVPVHGQPQSAVEFLSDIVDHLCI